MANSKLPPRKGTTLTPTYRATPGATGPVSKSEYKRSTSGPGNGKSDYKRTNGGLTPTNIPMTKNRQSKTLFWCIYVINEDLTSLKNVGKLMSDQSDVTDSSTEEANTDQEVDTSTTDQSTDDSNGSEVDNNADDDKDKTVPYDRFHEVNEAKKAADERAKKAEEELEKLRGDKTDKSEEEPDPDVEKVLEDFAKRKGFVSKTEIQLQSDIQELKTEYSKTGVPFDDKKVYEYAQKNGLQVPQSKAAWRAAYRDMNHDSILEAERKRAVTEYREGNKSTAEKPGPGGAKKPTEARGEDRKSRIHNAAQKIFAGK